MKLENAILDIFDDVNLKESLVKVASKLPQDLRNEHLPDVNERDSLPDSDFALSLFTKSANKINRFPVNSKINTALSNIYFDLNHSKLPLGAVKVAASLIKKACDKYGLQPAYSVKKASLENITSNCFLENPLEETGTVFQEKKASSHFALNNRYSLESSDDIKKACTYFDKYAYQFNFEDRQEFAKNTYQRSKEMGIDTGKEISKYASAHYGDDYSFSTAISLRKSLLSDDSPLKDHFSKLASYKIKASPEVITKVLYELDKEAGFTKYYDSYLKNPCEAVSGLYKKATMVYNKNDIYMTEDDLKGLAAKKEKILKEYFGETLVKGLQSKSDGVEAFKALPEDTKDIIARIWNGEIQ